MKGIVFKGIIIIVLLISFIPFVSAGIFDSVKSFAVGNWDNRIICDMFCFDSIFWQTFSRRFLRKRVWGWECGFKVRGINGNKK